MNDLLLKALRCEPVIRPPVWLMRQAGRYMPQYRALRQRHTLAEMFQTPRLITEITQLPLDLLGVDAAIIFSDILLIAEVFGLTVQFPESGGPKVFPPIHTAEHLSSLPQHDVGKKLGYLFEAISEVKGEIDVPLIGFCGGPFTVASYLIDSTSRQAFERTLQWLRSDVQSFHILLSKITEASILLLKEQIAAGADVIQVFDSWANLLTEEEFERFCLPYLRQIVQECGGTPVILFCRHSSLRVEALVNLCPAGISFDWHCSLQDLRKKVPPSIAVQGNFPPELLLRPSDEISKEVRTTLLSLPTTQGVIINLGHGVTPDIPLPHVQAFVQAVKG